MLDTEILHPQQHSQPQPQPQHVALYLQHRRALVEWLLEVASVNPLGLAAPSSLAHKAVALLDEVISVPRLPLLCAVDPVRLPLMAVACLSIACKKQHNTHNNTHNYLRNSNAEEREVGVVVQDRQQEGGQIFSLGLLNKFCHDKYSEEIIAKMEALLTRIIELARQQKYKNNNNYENSVHNKEQKSHNEEEGITSFDWLAHFLEVLGKELPQQEDATDNQSLHCVLSEYANLFLDLFLHEDSTYLGTYSGRLIAAASLGAARQQLGQMPVWLPCLEGLTGCSFADVTPCLNIMWQRAQEEFEFER